MLAAYLPFYLQVGISNSNEVIFLSLQTTLSLDKKLIAIVPLIQFVFGFFASFGMEPLAKKIGKVQSLLLGCLMMLATNIVLGATFILSQTAICCMAIIQGSATTIFVVQSLVKCSSSFRLFFGHISYCSRP